MPVDRAGESSRGQSGTGGVNGGQSGTGGVSGELGRWSTSGPTSYPVTRLSCTTDRRCRRVAGSQTTLALNAGDLGRNLGVSVTATDAAGSLTAVTVHILC